MRRFWVGGVWVLGLILIGCATKSDPVVLQVGEEQIGVAEFERLFWEASRRDSTLGPDLAGLQRFAEIEAENRLIQILALQHQPDLEPGRLDRLIDYEQTSAVEHLRKVEFGSAYNVRSSEIEVAYEKLGKIRRLRRIAVATEREAREVARAVREGALFDKVAASVSLDPETKNSGGEIGWLAYNDLPDFDRGPVFEAEVGTVTGPIPTGRVWSVYQIVDEDENASRGTLAEETPRLKDLLIRQQVRVAQREYETRLMEDYEFRFFPAEVAWLTVYMQEKTAGAVRGTDVLSSPDSEERDGLVYTSGRVPWEGAPVAPADTGRVVAQVNHPNGRVTPGIVFSHLTSISTPTWPSFDTSADVERLVRELVLERLEFWESEKRNYAEFPEVRQGVQKREREIRRRQFVRNVVRRPLIPTEEEIRAEYERRIDEYREPERRSFVAINVSSLAAAQKVVALLEEGRLAGQLELEFSAADSFQSTGSAGTPPMTREEAGSVLSDAFFALGDGGISDPIPFGDTFTVGKVVMIDPARTVPFEEVKIKLQIGMVDKLADAKLDEMIEGARAAHPVVLSEEALREVRALDPALGS